MTAYSDDQRLYEYVTDRSGGINTRMEQEEIGQNQDTILENADLSTPGKCLVRGGTSQILDDLGSLRILNMQWFSTASKLMMMTGTTLYETADPTGANWTSKDSGFTSNLYPTVLLEAMGKIWISNGTDVVHYYDNSSVTECGANSDDAPKGIVGAYFKNRLWLANVGANIDYVYFSDVLDATDDAWDQSNQVFKVGSGEGTKITNMVPYQNDRLLIFKEDSIYELIIQGTEYATWTLRPVDLKHGCPAYNGVAYLGGDIYYISRDGIRSVLQQPNELPHSWMIKDEWDDVNMQYIATAYMTSFQDKLLVALPTGSTAYNDKVYVYHQQSKGWSIWTGINVGCFGRFDTNDAEGLYYGEASADSVCYKMFNTYNDAGTAIHYLEETRAFNFEQPFKYKVGGELEIGFQSGQTININVYANPDNQAWNLLGTIVTYGINLPVYLPFTLGGLKERQKFHLDRLEKFRQIKIRVDNNDVKGADLSFLDILLSTHLEEEFSE